MTLLDAKQYDFSRARRRRNAIIMAVMVGVFLAWFAYHERNHAERQAVRDFFAALESRTYEQAYSLW
jgi:lipopolysaccharide export system protein LptC